MIITPARKILLLLIILTATLIVSCKSAQEGSADSTITISVIGTNDVHGQLLDVNGNRGLALFAGYVNNLRALRETDGGAVLLIGAGDMWQGTLESNITEGASVVEAYNALGYAAVAIGNHEFDFGPAGELEIPRSDTDDPQGALKQRATEAAFPFLAANLIDVSTGEPVTWNNVYPSVTLDIAGIKVGIIGVIAERALSATIAANTAGLRVAPLVPAITEEAQKLRREGAELVIVTAHAGSRCTSFDNPLDLSSCDTDGEIMQVANALPAGLVDQIVAGHVHQGIAHDVNGVAVTSSFSRSQAFGRVDFKFDLQARTVTERNIHPPQAICAYVDTASGSCLVATDEGAAQASYEGRTIVPDDTILAVVERAAAIADEVKSQKLGVYLDTPITLDGGTESALGHLLMDAVLQSSEGDILIHNVMGGIRANLPPGELTYGSVYEVFPFDNRVVSLPLSGAELRSIIAREAYKSRRAGFSGMRVSVACANGELDIDMLRPDDSEISDQDSLIVLTNNFLATGGDGIFAPVMPAGGFTMPEDTPLVRDVFASWLRIQGGHMDADQFLDSDSPRWNFDNSFPDSCTP